MPLIQNTLDPEEPALPQGFTPRSWSQWRFWNSTAPEVLYVGQYNSGKSFALCWKCVALSLAFERNRGILGRKTRESMEATTGDILLNEVLTPAQKAAWWQPSKSAVIFPNGSILWLVGLDNPGRALSGNLGFAALDEAVQCTETQWDAVEKRVRLFRIPFRQMFGTTNPDSPEHWLAKRFRVHLGNHVQTIGGRVRRELINSQMGDNREFWADDYDLKLSDLSGAWRQRYVFNRWAGFEGQVFEAWDPVRHIIGHEHPALASWRQWGWLPPPDWERYMALDYGWGDPFVAQWWTRSPDRHWFLYREIYHSKRLAEDHARQILDLEARELATLRDAAKRMGRERDLASWLNRLNVVARFSDHDRGEREAMHRHGVPTRAAVKDVLTGIQEVIKVLAADDQGQPWARIIRDARVELDRDLVRRKVPTCTAEEIGGIRWPDKRDNLNQVRSAQELPVDRNNHGSDAMRYLFRSLVSMRPVRVS